MTRRAGNETITVSQELATDDLDNPIPGSDTPVSIEGCALWPRGSTEESGRQQTVITGMTLIIPDNDAPVTEKSVITWRGKSFTVEGEPGPWYFLDGSPAGLQVALRKGKG